MRLPGRRRRRRGPAGKRRGGPGGGGGTRAAFGRSRGDGRARRAPPPAAGPRPHARGPSPDDARGPTGEVSGLPAALQREVRTGRAVRAAVAFVFTGRRGPGGGEACFGGGVGFSGCRAAQRVLVTVTLVAFFVFFSCSNLGLPQALGRLGTSHCLAKHGPRARQIHPSSPFLSPLF